MHVLYSVRATISDLPVSVQEKCYSALNLHTLFVYVFTPRGLISLTCDEACLLVP